MNAEQIIWNRPALGATVTTSLRSTLLAILSTSMATTLSILLVPDDPSTEGALLYPALVMSMGLATAPFVTAPVEMIAVFHKGGFRRPATGGRHGDITRDEFLAWTLGMWTFAGANPRRVGHPAPFPEELPRRLIKLYSYPEDLVLDPFSGSGTTLVAAKRLGRNSVGVEINATFCELTVRNLQTVELAAAS